MAAEGEAGERQKSGGAAGRVIARINEFEADAGARQLSRTVIFVTELLAANSTAETRTPSAKDGAGIISNAEAWPITVTGTNMVAFLIVAFPELISAATPCVVASVEVVETDRCCQRRQCCSSRNSGQDPGICGVQRIVRCSDKAGVESDAERAFHTALDCTSLPRQPGPGYGRN